MATGTNSALLKSEEGRRPICLSSIGCPRLSPSTIPRDRVTAVLSERDWRLGLVTGGAATGKSVAVAQWFLTLQNTASEWVTLSKADDQPARWWAVLLTALDGAAPGAFSRSFAVAAANPSSEEIVAAILVELALIGSEFVLVLDDVHLLRNAEVWNSIAQLVHGLPDNARFVITSRCDPPIPRALWSARGWLKEIRQADLAFRLPEATEYLNLVGELRLTSDEIEDIWRRSEGWAGCLTILATQMRRSGRISDVLEQFSGRHPIIADLLVHEVVDLQSGEVTDFMLRTSILDVLDPELCDAVSGRTDSRDILGAIEAHVPFVTAMNGDGIYRYHPLLKEVLRWQLNVRMPGTAPDLAATAAACCRGRGDLIGAVGYLITSGNHDEAFATALGAAQDRCDQGDVGAAAAWIDLIRTDVAAESARMMLIRAVGLSIVGRAEESLAWIRRAEIRFEQSPLEFGRERAVAAALQLHACATSTGTGDAFESGHRALVAVDREIDFGHAARVRPDLARAYLLADLPECAEDVLETQSGDDELARLIDAPGLRARALARMGRLTEAMDLATGALIVVRVLGAERQIGALDVGLAEASLLAERNQIGDAEMGVKQLLADAEAHPGALVYRVLSTLERVRLAAAHGGPEDGLAVVDEARTLLGVRRRPILATLIDSFAARWSLEAGLESSVEALLSSLPSDHRLLDLLHARLHLVRGEPDQSMARLEHIEFPDRRRQLERELLRVRAAIMLDDPMMENYVAAAVTLAASEKFVLTILEEGPIVTRLVRAAADQLETSQGRALAQALGAPPKARTSAHTGVLLSDSERNVLRFLPTSLTKREIAQECCVSVNTVKAHVKHIYQKLGVSTRASAGDRARALGLI